MFIRDVGCSADPIHRDDHLGDASRDADYRNPKRHCHVEAQNPDEIEFGDERFIAALKELAARPAAEIVAEMFERKDRFVDGAPQHDDITLVLIKAE